MYSNVFEHIKISMKTSYCGFKIYFEINNEISNRGYISSFLNTIITYSLAPSRQREQIIMKPHVPNVRNSKSISRSPFWSILNLSRLLELETELNSWLKMYSSAKSLQFPLCILLITASLNNQLFVDDPSIS